jgi:hypothetical protein
MWSKHVIAALTPEAEVLQQIVDYLTRLGLPTNTVRRFESELTTTRRSVDELKQIFETLRRVER